MSVHPCPAPKCRGVDGNAVLTDGAMCEHHVGKLGEALREFPGYYRDLANAMLPMQGAGDDVRVTTTSSRPLPINGDARAAQEDMGQLLRKAEVAYRRHRGWSATPRQGEASTIVDLAKWCGRHLDGLLGYDVRFGVAALKLKHRCRLILGDVKLVHRLGAPCPDCDAPLLVREDGDDHVVCRGCGVAFAEKHYGMLARLAAEGLVEPPRPDRRRPVAGGKGFGW